MGRTNMMVLHDLGKSLAQAGNSPEEMEKLINQGRRNRGVLRGFSEDEIEELMHSYRKFRPEPAA